MSFYRFINTCYNQLLQKSLIKFGTPKLEYSSQGPQGDVLRKSRINLPGTPLNVRLGHPLDVISSRPQDIRLARAWDVRPERPRDGQIGSLGKVLGTLEGAVLGTNIWWLGRSYFRRIARYLYTRNIVIKTLQSVF